MSIHLTVSDLKNALKDLPDDMPIVIPVLDYENRNNILAFQLTTSAGILFCENEVAENVFCLSSSLNGFDISTQLKDHCSADSSIVCEKLIY